MEKKVIKSTVRDSLNRNKVPWFILLLFTWMLFLLSEWYSFIISRTVLWLSTDDYTVIKSEYEWIIIIKVVLIII